MLGFFVGLRAEHACTHFGGKGAPVRRRFLMVILAKVIMPMTSTKGIRNFGWELFSLQKSTVKYSPLGECNHAP
jgi:hypothetical protein